MENRDQLKEFVEANRTVFDNYQAPEGLWDKIEDEIDQHRPKPWKWVLVAAVIAVLCIATTLFYLNMEEQVTPDPEVNYLYAQFEDYSETENYFVMQSDFLWEEIRKMHTDATLEKDLSLLDENEIALRQELENADNDNREYVIRAILKNQEIKMNLLKNVLQQIKQKNIKNENHEII